MLVLLSAGVLVLGALWLFQNSPKADAARERAEVLAGREAGSEAPAPPRITVDALVVSQRPSRTRVEIAGVLEPVRSVSLAAEVPGRVIEVAVEEHSHVAAGALLARLDPALPEAAVAQARASLLRAQATARLARADLRRQRGLADKGVTSAAELDRAESDERAKAAQVAEARAALVDAETRLAKTRIEAPFAGVVSSFDLEPGAYLQPGSPVAELADLTEIEIEVGVGDSQILGLRGGDPVQVVVNVLPGESFEGRIHELGRVADAQTRKYPVPVRVANADERLLPGMLGTVRFELGDEAPALRIPRGALQREFELEHLFVLESEGDDGLARARRRRVAIRPVAFRPDQVEVTEGLEAGDRIAITGVRELRDGLRVAFVDREPGT
jgi:RND family efflux transporter MFP subunit